jgi:2,3-dihydroxybenzoate decarboxylase
VRHTARDEHVSIPEPAERWPSACGQGEIVFSRRFAADAARRRPEFTEYRLADMDAAGTGVQVLWHTVPGVQAGTDAATGLLRSQPRAQLRTTGRQQRTGTSPPRRSS